MTVTKTINRIANYGVAIMAFATLILWIVDSYILSPKQARHIGVITESFSDKSATVLRKDNVRMGEDNALEHEHDKFGSTQKMKIVRKSGKAESEIASVKSTTWRREASLSDPDFRRMQILYRAKNNDRYYLDLYKILRLDDQASDSLRELLADRSIATGLLTTDQNISDEDYPNILKHAKAQYDQRIAALLGQEGYALFSEYETTLPERFQIMRFRENLEFSDEPLTVEQETALLTAFENYWKSNPLLESMAKSGSNREPMDAAFTLGDYLDGKLDLFNGILTPGQIDTITRLRTRDAYLHLIKYAWGTMGERIRRQNTE